MFMFLISLAGDLFVIKLYFELTHFHAYFGAGDIWYIHM